MNSKLTPIKVIHCSGILVELLNEKKEMNSAELQSFSNFDDKCFYMAIGYLMREGVILFFEQEHFLILNY